MTAGWVAASTRGRSLLRQLVGAEFAAELTELDWPDARSRLTATVYGRQLPAGADRSAARRVAMNATAWQLRVLAGWLPPAHAAMARLFAGPLEIANIERHLTGLSLAHPTAPPIALGSLAVAWPRVSMANTPEDVRAILTHSVWGDPGGSDRATVALGLRLSLLRRLANLTPSSRPWSRGGAAVLLARERFSFGRPVTRAAARHLDALLGRRWTDADSVSDLGIRLSDDAAWALSGIDRAEDLWRAEIAVAARMRSDATTLAGRGRADLVTVAAVMTLLLLDLRDLLAAIELAGGGARAREVFDAVV